MTRRRRSPGATIGSILVGFDHQVFRATKPPAELVESAKPLPTVAGSDGSLLSIALPELNPADGDGAPPRAVSARADSVTDARESPSAPSPLDGRPSTGVAPPDRDS